MSPVPHHSLVILPTYNESENLEPIVRSVLSQSPEFEVLIVDDNSPDGTGQIADRLATEEPDGRAHVLHRAGKLGLGTAYLAGFAWALERGYGYLFEMDADFSHDPSALLRLRDVVQRGEADLAVGSRWVAQGGTRNWSLLRTIVSRGGSLYARTILGMPMSDMTSGFKCFSRRALEAIDLDEVRSNGYGFQIELNYRCHQLGFRIAEVPIVFVNRRAGSSKMNKRIVAEAMGMVLRLRLASAIPARAPGAPELVVAGERAVVEGRLAS